jgi:hypothetical protein
MLRRVGLKNCFDLEIGGAEGNKRNMKETQRSLCKLCFDMKRVITQSSQRATEKYIND